MSAIENPNVVMAAALIANELQPPGEGPPQFPSRGFATFQRVSAGQYRLVMENGAGWCEAVAFATVAPNTPYIVGAQITDPGVVLVSCFDPNGTPIDPPFVSVTVLGFAIGAPVIQGITSLTPPTPNAAPSFVPPVARVVVNADGTVAYTSKIPASGDPFFTVNKTGTGVYQLIPGVTPTIPSLSTSLLTGSGGGQISNDGGLQVYTFDAAGAPVDAAFQAYLYDSTT